MEDYKKSKKIYIFSFVFVVCCILLRLFFYLRLLSVREVYFASDNAIYAMLSKRFLEGNFIEAFHPYWSPGFPLITVAFYILSRSWEKAQVLVSIASVTILPIIIFLFYKNKSIALALVISFITTFSITIEKLVLGDGISEPLYMFFLWTALLLGYQGIVIAKKQKIYLFISGIFFGLAYLTRTEIMPIMGFFIFILILSKFQINIKKFILSVVLLVLYVIAPFFIINIPYVYVQSKDIGKFTFSGKYAYIGSGPYYELEKTHPSTFAQDVWSIDFPNYRSPYFDSKRAMASFWKYTKNGTMFSVTKESLKESLFLYRSVNTNNFFHGIELPLAITGFFLGLISKKYRNITLFLFSVCIVGLLWVAIFMAPHYRYLVFALPFFFYLQGISIYSFASFLGKFSKTAMATFLLAALFAYFKTNVDINHILHPTPNIRYKDHQEIGEWIKSQNIKLIGARYEGIPFYAEAQEVYIPSDSPEVIVQYMKDWGVEYMVISPDDAGYDIVRPITSPNYKNTDISLYKLFDNGAIVWKINLTEEEKKYNQRNMLQLYQ